MIVGVALTGLSAVALLLLFWLENDRGSLKSAERLVSGIWLSAVAFLLAEIARALGEKRKAVRKIWVGILSLTVLGPPVVLLGFVFWIESQGAFREVIDISPNHLAWFIWLAFAARCLKKLGSQFAKSPEPGTHKFRLPAFEKLALGTVLVVPFVFTMKYLQGLPNASDGMGALAFILPSGAFALFGVLLILTAIVEALTTRRATFKTDLSRH